MTKLRIRQISESAFSIKGHGVHTAFIETVRALRQKTNIIVQINTDRGVSDVIHIHTVGVYAWSVLLFSKGKKVVSAHVVPASFVGSLALAEYWLPFARYYLRWFYNRADLVVAVSDSAKRELELLGVTKPIEVIYNMIDTSQYKVSKAEKQAARKKLGIEKDEWVVIGAGQIQPRKRVDSMVRVAKALPDMRFIWVGGMPFGRAASDSTQMHKMIERTPSNMLFTGIIPLENMKDYYAAADAFFLPSDQETFGLVVVEAAAAGLPIVLRDIIDYKETFGDLALLAGETTFTKVLVKLRDDKHFYQAACRDSQKIAEKFDSDEGAQKLINMYEALISR